MEHIKNFPYFPKCILVFNILVDFFVIICGVQVMYDVQETVWCHSSGVERCEKLICPCPIVPESVTYVLTHLYNDYHKQKHFGICYIWK